MKEDTRLNVLSMLDSRLRKALPELDKADPDNFIGVYTRHMSRWLLSLADTSWFDMLSDTEKSYCIVYSQIRFAQAVMDLMLGGDIDEQEKVEKLQTRLGEMYETASTETLPYLDSLALELAQVKTEEASAELSRRIKILQVEGLDEYKRFTE